MKLPSWVSEYTAGLREEAERRRNLWIGDPLASVLPGIAREIEQRAEAYELETLTIAEAAGESGYNEGYLYRAVKVGRIPNAGKDGAPRVRRCHLPRKAVRGSHRSGTTIADEILARLEAGA